MIASTALDGTSAVTATSSSSSHGEDECEYEECVQLITNQTLDTLKRACLV
jgi:hypothetical protein